MDKKYDVAALGEYLIDVIITSPSDAAAVAMTGNAGGAPVNVLSAVTRLGRTGAYLGKLSRDPFGTYLARVMKENGVDSSGVVYTDDHTTLAIVALDEKGDRSFTFYRENTADVNYSFDEVDLDVVEQSRIFHFGSVSMTSQPSRDATLKTAEYAKKRGVKVSFDPNLRPALWGDIEKARPCIEAGLALADYVKVADEELEYLTGTADPEAGAEILLERYHPELLCVTMGAKGCALFCGEVRCYEPTYDVKTVDTTGSGDAFWGAVLAWLAERECGLAGIDKKTLSELARFANAAGSLCSAKYGAIGAMPDRKSILACMEADHRLILCQGGLYNAV